MLISVGHTYPDGEIGSILSPKIKAVACSTLLPGSLASCLPPQARVTPEKERSLQYRLLPEGLSELRGRRGGHGQKAGDRAVVPGGVSGSSGARGSPGRGERLRPWERVVVHTQVGRSPQWAFRGPQGELAGKSPCAVSRNLGGKCTLWVGLAENQDGDPPFQDGERAGN